MLGRILLTAGIGLLISGTMSGTTKKATSFEEAANSTGLKVEQSLFPRTDLAQAQNGKLMKVTTPMAETAEEPQGRKQPMKKTSDGWFLYYYYVREYESEQAPAEVIYGDNDEVYFKDMFVRGFLGTTYTKGRKEGKE